MSTPVNLLALYLDTLKRAGLRLTDQRQIVCEYLAQTTAHPTPYQVFADLSQQNPEISRSTVYNTLNTLQQLGAIVELSFGTDHTHYDTDPSPHVNLICLRCHKIVDYRGNLPLPEVQQHLGQETGFWAVSARVDVLGYCSECAPAVETAATTAKSPYGD
jgi:Fur family peroxide stress response transcriptional regulator